MVVKQDRLQNKPSIISQGALSVMRIHTFIFALALLVAGCGGHDAKLRQQIAGTWPVPPSGSITFLSSGCFHFTNSYVSTNATMTWTSDGTWEVRDGFLITTITNSIASGTDEKAQVGQTSRSKINFIDEHNLCYGDESHGSAYHR
jgi:hypothetical protein